MWDNDYGFDVSSSHNIAMTGNMLVANTADAIAVTGVTNVTFAGNMLVGNAGGLLLVGASGTLAYHITFTGNGMQAWDNAGPENAWDGGYPTGGNYWSDYAGTDNCSGPRQDVCSDPDGIGDTPYVIDADTMDRYPLMSPAPGLTAKAGPTLGTDAPAMLRQRGEPAMMRGDAPDSGPMASRPTPGGSAWPAASDPSSFRRLFGVRAF